MKISLGLLISVLLFVNAGTCQTGAGLAKTERATLDYDGPAESSAAIAGLPDLIVMSVDSDNLDHGEVKVKIKNQGQRNAVRSDVVLTMTWGTKTLSFTHASIPLAPGQMDMVTIDVKMSLVQARFCATADGTKKVNEGNETNNKLCGRFDGKP
jgi:hypothetical protein